MSLPIPSVIGLPPRLRAWWMHTAYAAARKSTTCPGGTQLATGGESADYIALPPLRLS